MLSFPLLIVSNKLALPSALCKGCDPKTQTSPVLGVCLIHWGLPTIVSKKS